MNKQWLIKINDEDNLYYDSESKEYRLRLLCPYCHKPSGCQCYESYEDYEYDSESGFPVMCCSYLCCLMESTESGKGLVIKAAQYLGIGVKPLAEYTEKEAEHIIDYIVDECGWDISEDSEGEQCEM